jgi:hypothetical protein
MVAFGLFMHLTYKYNIYWHMEEEKRLNIDEWELGIRNQGLEIRGIGNNVEMLKC